jgi:hypothetical protein
MSARLTLTPMYYLERQIAREHARQRGWQSVCAASGKPADQLPPGGAIVYGPPGAHLDVEAGAA